MPRSKDRPHPEFEDLMRLPNLTPADERSLGEAVYQQNVGSRSLNNAYSEDLRSNGMLIGKHVVRIS